MLLQSLSWEGNGVTNDGWVVSPPDREDAQLLCWLNLDKLQQHRTMLHQSMYVFVKIMRLHCTQPTHTWNIAIVDRIEIDRSGLLICSSIVQGELQMETCFLNFNFNFKLKSLLSFLIQVLPVKSKDSGLAVYRWLSGCPSINCLSTTPWSLLFSLLL